MLKKWKCISNIESEAIELPKKWAWKLIFCLFPAFLRAKPTVQWYIHFMVNFVDMKSIGWERRQRCRRIGGFAKAFSSWLVVRAFFPSDSPPARQLRANSSVSTETQHLSLKGGSYMKREISDGSVDLNSSVIFLDVKKTLSAWFNNSDIGRKDDMLRLWCFQVEVVLCKFEKYVRNFCLPQLSHAKKQVKLKIKVELQKYQW